MTAPDNKTEHDICLDYVREYCGPKAHAGSLLLPIIERARADAREAGESRNRVLVAASTDYPEDEREQLDDLLCRCIELAHVGGPTKRAQTIRDEILSERAAVRAECDLKLTELRAELTEEKQESHKMYAAALKSESELADMRYAFEVEHKANAGAEAEIRRLRAQIQTAEQVHDGVQASAGEELERLKARVRELELGLQSLRTKLVAPLPRGGAEHAHAAYQWVAAQLDALLSANPHRVDE